MGENRKLKERDIYLNRLIAFQDTEPVKVITGIRRCGKSSLLKLMQEHLLRSGVKQEQIIAINFESLFRRIKEAICFLMNCKEFINGKMRLIPFE